jgi:acetylornithine/N-succinyldiaminopimelate aminotransferase
MLNTTERSRSEQMIQDDQDYVVQTYKRAPFLVVGGEGAYVHDSDGNAYLDWVAGIAVNALGYGDAGLQQALHTASNGLIHTSNLYYTPTQPALAKLLVEKSFADRVFFSNSGAEANEGAMKFARKVQYEKGMHEKTEVVCFSGAFHGRTMGAVAVTPKEKYQKPFHPLMGGVVVATYNDLDSARAVIGEKTAAVIVEPIQGEGGIHIATDAFLRGLRELCDQHGAVLIFDEVQCGVGRTGKLWAHEWTGVTPDIMTLAKPLAGGLPIGAILMTEAVASAMHAGEHGSTFAGGPFVTGVAQYVVERISQPEFLAHVSEVGDYLQERLSELNSPLIQEVRGRGLMVALEMTVDVSNLVDAGYKHGLLLVNAGTHVVRFVPPLIVEKKHVDVLVEKLTTMLTEIN